MAIFDKVQRRLNAVKYISKIDSALDKEDPDFDENWEKFIEDPNKNLELLKLKKGQEPTYFILNFELNAKDESTVKDSRISRVDEDKQPVMAMGKWGYTVTKLCLKDIQNPPGVQGIEFKKDGRGHVAETVMDKLSKFGIVDEIWELHLGLTQAQKEMKDNAKN